MNLAVQRRLVAGAALGLVIFAMWRVTVGADFGDGTHVVALAMRMAEGDWPLADELNLQALGSLPAVPFTWVWLSTVGIEGIVLASRLWFVVLAVLAGVMSYRALRTSFSPISSFVAVTVMVVPTPYSLLVTSYNSVPVLGLAIAACAAFAAVQVGSGRWAAVSGAAAAFSALAHPAIVPSALALLIVAFAVGRGTVRRGLVTGSVGLGLMILGVLLLGPGPGALFETLRYTADYQAARLTAWERLTRAVGMHVDGLLVWRNVPALVLALLAGLPWLPGRWRGLLATTSILALAVAIVAAAWSMPPADLLLGPVSSAFVVLVAVLLLPFLPLALPAVRDWDGGRQRLLLLTGPPAVIGFLAVSLVSSGSAKWGVAAAPVQPFAGALVVCVLVLIERHHTRVVAVLAALALLTSLLTVHSMRSFRDVQPARLDGRVTQGPLAGLLTHQAYLDEDCRLRAAVGAWTDHGDSIFFWAAPAGYVYTEGPMDTHNIWSADFGEANRAGVDWMNRTGRWPDVAFIHAPSLAAAGGWDKAVARDPILAAFDRDYGPPTEVPGFLVLRRDGTNHPVGAAPACDGTGR